MGAASITKAMHDDENIKPSKIILEKSFGVMTDAAEGLCATVCTNLQNLWELYLLFGVLQNKAFGCLK